VHDIVRTAFPKTMLETDTTGISESQLDCIHVWSRGLFLKRCWSSKNLYDFEIICNFLYDVVCEDDIEYPVRLTWINNIRNDPDKETYATRLLFILTCSKRVTDTSLSSLEHIVNDSKFSLAYILSMGQEGVCKLINHLGYGNKNAETLFKQFLYLKCYIETKQHFPRTIRELTMIKGIGTKIASLVLYFAFGQNDAIAVDSHVMKCAQALRWVPDWCKTPDTVRLCLQAWIPTHFWPHVNIILASCGQLLSNRQKALTLLEASKRDMILSFHISPLIWLLVKQYQPDLVPEL